MKVKLTPVGRFGKPIFRNAELVTVRANAIECVSYGRLECYNTSEWAVLIYDGGAVGKKEKSAPHVDGCDIDSITDMEMKW